MSLCKAGAATVREVRLTGWFSVCPSPLSHNSHTHIKMFTVPCVLAYLICGNGGSSDEGRDGGLCNHAVGGDAVRRGVEPDKRQTSKKNP